VVDLPIGVQRAPASVKGHVVLEQQRADGCEEEIRGGAVGILDQIDPWAEGADRFSEAEDAFGGNGA